MLSTTHIDLNEIDKGNLDKEISPPRMIAELDAINRYEQMPALTILAVLLSIYLLKIDDDVGHLFMLMGVGLCTIALLPYIFNSRSDISTVLIILGLGCIAWGLTLRKKRFRPQKKRSWKL